MVNPWTFDRDLKKGQAMQIAQAWNQHVAERKRISTTSHDVRDILEVEWQKEMNSAQNEVFIAGIEFPSPLVSEIYTNAQNVMKEARCRGHGVGTAMSLETGWDFSSLPSKSRFCQGQGREAILLGVGISMWALVTADESPAFI